MLNSFLADLHVHTVLSSCAEVEMIPPLIADRARRLGLGMIAITDHNACANVEAVQRAAAPLGLHVLPGMELQTAEEVHLLCLFDTIGQCLKWQEEVFQHLPSFPNKEDLFGPQYVVDASGDWLRTEERLLSTSADIAIETAAAKVHKLGGIVIPAHVDRPSFSLFSNLGFLPDGLDVDAVEVTSRFLPREGLRQWPQLESSSLIVSGDAHRLEEIQNRTLFRIAAPAIEELSLAFKGLQGRKVIVDWIRKG